MFIDIAFMVALFYGLFLGYKQGLFDTIMNYIKIAIALILALKFSYFFSGEVQRIMPLGKSYAPILSFVLMFIAALAGFQALNMGVRKYSGDGNYNLVHKGMGVLLWLFVLSTVFSFIFYYGEKSDIMTPTFCASSSVYPHIDWVWPAVRCQLQYISPAFQDLFFSLQTALGDAADGVKGECFR